MLPALAGQITEYIIDLFQKHHQPYLLYHNLEHTKFVVSKAVEIAGNYSLQENETFILVTAACFHDTGQLLNYGSNHELKSVSLMKDFLADKNIEAATIDAIEKCIVATRIPHHPRSLSEEIICDADTYNLGTKDFIRTNELLKKECELKTHIKYDNWDKTTLAFLERHKYFTAYCQRLLNKGKQNNIHVLRAKLNDEI